MPEEQEANDIPSVSIEGGPVGEPSFIWDQPISRESTLVSITNQIRTPTGTSIWETNALELARAYMDTGKTLVEHSKPKISKDNKVELFETGNKEDVENTIYINKIGYFLKTDKRLTKDFFTGENIIVDKNYKKYYGHYFTVVTAIKENGQPDLDTLAHGTDIHRAKTSLPNLYIHSDSIYPRDINGNILSEYLFTTKQLLSDSLFVEYYRESIRHGCFVHKANITKVEQVKNKKWSYRKRKLNSLFGFSKYMQDKPKLYNAMMGKKYTYGIEIETSSGLVPERFDSELFYSAVHDGSLKDEEGNVFGKRKKFINY
jgi:hypothetical protein